jgi:hypothetical protein
VVAIDDVEQVAAPAEYLELVAAGAGAALWIGLLVSEGPLFALQTIWILVASLGVGGWTLLQRLRFSRSRLRITLGPWSRAADLTQLESIHWKEGAVLSSWGRIYVRDRSGHRVPIEVGRFRRGKEWGPLLLRAAADCKASVDEPSRLILEHGGRAPYGGV